MTIFNNDMVEVAGKNALRKEQVYRGPGVRIVTMSVPAGEEIGR